MERRTRIMTEFLSAMYRYAPGDARVMACQFRGDPNAEGPGKWVSRPVTCIEQLDDAANVYVAVSAMRPNERGEYRRRKENFAAGLLLMIDDIGTGPGSKFPISMLSDIAPTALIETSPQNHQAVYMFASHVTDAAQFDLLINGFIAKKFLGTDTGMAGINRVFRPPFGVNGKPKYGGWKVECSSWNPHRRYHIADLAAAFDIDITPKAIVRKPFGATRSKSDDIRSFVAVRQALRVCGMLKRDEPDLAGWQDVVCPWTGGHTHGANNGAAIREPADENGSIGAFRCHHGSCKDKGWRELTEWLAENQSEILNSVNCRAPGYESFI